MLIISTSVLLLTIGSLLAIVFCIYLLLAIITEYQLIQDNKKFKQRMLKYQAKHACLINKQTGV